MAGINATLRNYKSDEEMTMLTKEDIMGLLHMKNEKTFYDLIYKKNLPCKKLGGRYMISISDYKKWLRNV